MSGEGNVVSTERLMGAELIRAAEGLLAGLRPDALDPVLAVQLATIQILLGVYWELRHQHHHSPVVVALAAAVSGRPGAVAGPSVEWLSALLCSVRAEATATTPADPPAVGAGPALSAPTGTAYDTGDTDPRTD